MLATTAAAAFDDPKWLFELKWDGYRALARVERDGSVAIVSRNGNDFAAKFPELAALRDAFAERPVLVDGEIVVLDADGRPSFGALQERLDRFGRSAPHKAPVTFVAFDLLYGNGRDLRGEPLSERKAALEAIMTGKGPAMFSKHVVGDGVKLYALAEARGLEGIVAKRAASTYQERRSSDWVKIKAVARQEVVIGGFTEGTWQSQAFRRLARGRVRRRYVALRGFGRHGIRREEARRDRGEISAARTQDVVPSCEKPKTDTPAHWVTPSFGCRGGVHGVDARRAVAPPRLRCIAQSIRTRVRRRARTAGPRLRTRRRK